MTKFDASIPVLTEVLQDQLPAPAAADAPDSAQAAAALRPTPAASEAAAGTPAGAAVVHAERAAAWPFRVAPAASPAGAAAAEAQPAAASPVALAADESSVAPLAEEGAVPSTSEAADATASIPAEPMHAQPAAPAPVADAIDWAQLERQVSERVLQQLSNRVDFVLEQRIKDSMAEVLSHALRGLTDEIRDGLHDTIGKIVTRAVQQEITHLQASAPKQSEKR
ncbi:hypothetical protein [Pseudoduganella sp. RAF53_2]|uniref:hypothetical protein n=1 Tax=unclassified Pseudoduganella TaxID=2637179 RepID=UPI003F9741B5